MYVRIRLQNILQAVGEWLRQRVGSQDKSGEAVGGLRGQRGQADRLEEARANFQSLRVMREETALLLRLVSQLREFDQILEDVVVANEAEYEGHDLPNFLVVPFRNSHTRFSASMQVAERVVPIVWWNLIRAAGGRTAARFDGQKTSLRKALLLQHKMGHYYWASQS